MCTAPDGCSRPVLARKLCAKHYQRWRKTGDPLGLLPNLGNRTPRPVLTERTCRVCGFTGPLSAFRPRANICTPCSNDCKEERKRKNPEKWQAILDRGVETRRRYELRRRAIRAGQDPDFIEAYVARHDGTCEICGLTPGPGKRALNIDHNHRTGLFRGLICDNCNGGIGRFMDDPALLLAAAEYLRSRVSPYDLGTLLQQLAVTPVR